MRKKTLVWLTVLGSILFVVSFIAMIIGVAERSVALTALPEIAMFPAGVLVMVAWIGMLVIQAKQGQWSWFVCNLIFGWFTMILYLIIVPEMPEPVQPTYMSPYPPASPYQPYPPMSSYQSYQSAPLYQPYLPMEHNPSEEK
jgi:hypothetical protein